MFAGDLPSVDERDMSTFVLPRYRAVALTQIADESYTASDAWDLGAGDVESALSWCIEKRKNLASEPHRLELYALVAAASFASSASGIGQDDKVAILLQAWNWRVVVTEDPGGQVERIVAVP